MWVSEDMRKHTTSTNGREWNTTVHREDYKKKSQNI